MFKDWLIPTCIALLSVFFLYFGIMNLQNAYRMLNPLEFIMSFFSACLIVMISAVGLIHAAFRFRSLLGNKDKEHGDE